MFRIDLARTYDFLLSEITSKVSVAEFHSPQKDGEAVLMRMRIAPYGDPLLPGVYNLSMGPPGKNEKINDEIRLRHLDSAKVYSTAILFVLAFLTEYPQASVGLDGSNDTRASLYHSMFLLNKSLMREYFDTVGVD